jgi:hypothetical protein
MTSRSASERWVSRARLDKRRSTTLHSSHTLTERLGSSLSSPFVGSLGDMSRTLSEESGRVLTLRHRGSWASLGERSRDYAARTTFQDWCAPFLDVVPLWPRSCAWLCRGAAHQMESNWMGPSESKCSSSLLRACASISWTLSLSTSAAPRASERSALKDVLIIRDIPHGSFARYLTASLGGLHLER